jgi:hypothetical protein
MRQWGWSPRRIADAAAAAMRDRHARRLALAVAALYLLVYLLAIGDVVISPATDLTGFARIPSVQVASDWTEKLLQQRAAFSYEPVAAIYPVNHVAVFVSPVNLGMGLLVGVLAGLNVAVALLAARARRACRMRGLAGLLGALPALATGASCCVPTLAVALGAQFTAALLAIRGYLFPLAVVAPMLSLAWGSRQAQAASPKLPRGQSPRSAMTPLRHGRSDRSPAPPTTSPIRHLVPWEAPAGSRTRPSPGAPQTAGNNLRRRGRPGPPPAGSSG